MNSAPTAPEKPPKMPPTATACNGLNSSGGYCTLTPGFGTSHVGTGRCKFHGGADGIGRPPTHGLYASPERVQSIRAKAQELEGVPALDLLERSLRQGAALWEAWLDNHDNPGSLSDEDREHAVLLLQNIGKNVERVERIRNASALTIAEIRLYEARLADTIAKHLRDPAAVAAFLKDVAAITGARTIEALPAPEQAETGPDVH